MDLPFPDVGRSYTAVCDVPYLQRTIIVDRAFDEILSWCKPPTDIASVESREKDKQQSLDPWTEEEELSFGVKPTAKKDSAGEAQPPRAEEKPVEPADRRDLKH